MSLRPIDDSNRALVEALRVSPIQEEFVATVAESLVEAVEDPGGRDPAAARHHLIHGLRMTFPVSKSAGAELCSWTIFQSPPSWRRSPQLSRLVMARSSRPSAEIPL